MTHSIWPFDRVAPAVRLLKHRNHVDIPGNSPDAEANEWLSVTILTIATIPLASSALLLRAAIWSGLSFHVAAVALAVVTTILWTLTALRLFIHRPWSGGSRPPLGKSTALALSLACTAAVLCVLYLHRPDADDGIYLPKIVYSLAHPESVMDGTIHEVAHTPVLSLPLSAAPYYPDAYEFLQAAFVHLSGTDLFWVYYRLAPALAAMFGVLLLATNLRYLGVSGRASALAVLMLIPMILLMGISHRSFGNFTLVRMFQSKCAFIFFGLPMFTSLSVLFFRKPTRARWLLLLFGVVAIAGMTTSALVMLPLLSLPLFLAWWPAFGHGKDLRSTITRGIAYAASLLPALAFALDYRRYAQARVAYNSPLNAGFPKSFAGQFHLLTGGTTFSPSLLIFLGSGLVLAYFWREPRHRFLLVASLVTMILYLNPWVANTIMRHLTTENIYWRLFYLLPLSLMPGMAIATLYERAPGGILLKSVVSLAGFSALTAVVFVSPTSVTRPGNHVHISASGYPVAPNTNTARAVLGLASQGTILAPAALSRTMATLSAQHPLVVTRPDFLANALVADHTDYVRRMSAASLIAGRGGHIDDLIAVMQHLKPNTVVLARKAQTSRLDTILRGDGFRQSGSIDHWIVYGRSETSVGNRNINERHAQTRSDQKRWSVARGRNPLWLAAGRASPRHEPVWITLVR